MSADEAARPILADLERGVRLELLAAPVVVLLPLATAAALAWLGHTAGEPRLVVLAAVLAAGNLAFDVLMVRATLRFLRAVGLAPGGDAA